MKQIFMDFSGHFMWFVTIREMLHFVYRSFFYSIISGEKVIFGPQYITVHMDHFQDKTFHNNDDKLMTFIFFNEVFFFSFYKSIFSNGTPTANHTAEKQMHVMDAWYWPLPLTTTQIGKTECQETDKDKEIEPKQGHTTLLFWK